MPEVNFVGEIEYACVKCPIISITWAIVPGNIAWNSYSGSEHGETQSSITAEEYGRATLNHPIDAYYNTSSSEGWPFLVCEIWDKTDEGLRSFLGCGSAWLPSSSGRHSIDIAIWKPCSLGLDNLENLLLPSCPDLKALRKLTVSPYLRSQIETDSVGSIRVNMNTILAGFDDFGVILN